MIISHYVLCFFFYSLIGWVWETIFCTFTRHRWANRGFLYGPICPIYGAGGIAIQLLVQLLTSLTGAASATEFAWWQIFLFSFVVCTILEYITHYLLEKLFHAYWWDYTNMPLNINGRICLPVSACFGLAGVLLVYVVIPAAGNLAELVPDLLTEALALVLVFILGMDVMLTITSLTSFEKNVEAMGEKINQHMEQFVASLPGGRTGTEAAMVTEREAFSRKSMDELIENMRASGRSSIQRVKEYRPRKPRKSRKQPEGPELRDYLELPREQLDQLLVQVKEHLTKEKEKARAWNREQKRKRKQQKHSERGKH